jgi:exodeoxyribonuclease-3
VKIATWNVNSLRIREDAVLDWLEKNAPDVLCLQETKVSDQEFPEDQFGDLNYDVAYHGQRSYNGVAIVSRPEMRSIERGFGGDADDDKRLISAVIEGIRIFSVYVPNGQEVGGERYRFKLDWLHRLRSHLESKLAQNEPAILLGDYNVAPTDDDVFDPVALRGQLLASEPEREALCHLMGYGLVDALRHFDPKAKRFTWWDYRSGSWERNMGLRIDHILVTPPLVGRMKSIRIDEKERAKPQPSDHVPVVIELED